MALPCFFHQFKEKLFGGKEVPKFDFSNEEIASIWKYAREKYIDKGVDFHDLRDESGNVIEKGALSRVADDLGFPKGTKEQIQSSKNWVAQAFTGNKSLRTVTQDMWNKMYARRIQVSQARGMVADMDTPQWQNTIDKVYNAPRSLLIAGHAGVFPWTHMGQSLMVPTEWGKFFEAEKNSWSFFRPTKSGIAAHETAMINMQTLPHYDLMRRVTPSVDPGYTPPGIFSKYFGGSRRGMDSLKLARTEIFEREFVKHGLDELPPEQQLEAARLLMRPIEHATGIFMGKGVVNRNWMSRLVFAPQLLPARWAASMTDPMRAIATYGRWKQASAGERAAANFVAKRTAQTIGTMASIIALNDAVNKLTGSTDRVNISDPTKTDWLRLKVGGYNVPMSFTFEPIRLAIQMIASGAKPRRGETTETAFLRPAQQYGISKLHPTIAKVVEGLYGRQAMTERPLPFAKVAPFYQPKTKEKPQIGVGEYLSSLGPIPLGEGGRELHHLLTEEGMSKEDALTWVRAIAFAGLGSLGPRPYPETKPQPQSGKTPSF